MASTGITFLPVELVQLIAEHLLPAGLSALARASHSFYAILNPILYARAPQTHPNLGLWATANNQFRTLKLGLEAGINPNLYWQSMNWNATDESREIPAGDFHDTSQSPMRQFHWTALHIAALEGRDGLLQLLLEKGAYPYLMSHALFRSPLTDGERLVQGGEPLHLAILHDHALCVDLLLRGGASIYLQWIGRPPRGCLDGMTVLAAACRYGSFAVARLIVEKRYEEDINVQDHTGYTPVTYAFIYENWQCFDWLISLNADVNINPRTRESMLIRACREYRFKDALRLIDLGVDVTAQKTGDQYRPLHILCERLRPAEEHTTSQGRSIIDIALCLIDTLLEKGTDIEARGIRLNHHRVGDIGRTPLGVAARENNIFAAKHLLSKGAELHALQERGASVLMLACINEYRLPNASMVKMLINAGADVTQSSRNYGTALEKACLLDTDTPDKLEVIEILLDHGALPQIHERPVSPLTAAFRVGDAAACDLMLKRSSSSLTKVDLWAMFRAFLRTPNDDCLKLLLDADNEGWICSHESSVYQLLRALANMTTRKVLFKPKPYIPPPELAFHLLDRGAPCSYKDELGDTVLTLALRQRCSPELLRKLLELGADPNQGQCRERAPLSIAVLLQAIEGQYDCVKSLLDAGAKGIHQRFRGTGDSVFMVAIANPAGSVETLGLLLEREPLNIHPKAPISNMLGAAFRYGRNGVVRAIVESCKSEELQIKINANEHLHTLLDEFHSNAVDIVPTVHLLDEWFSCLRYLLDLGANINTRGKWMSGWQIISTARIKEASIEALLPHERVKVFFRRGIAECFHQIIDLEPYVSFSEGGPPCMTIWSESLCYYYGPTTTISQIGERALEADRQRG